MKFRRPLIALAVVAILPACSTSDPPTAELAEEVIDSLDVDDSVKECMYGVVENFELTDDELQFVDDLGDAADQVDSDNSDVAAAADGVMSRFEAELAACN